jgi:hypothetical protein
VKDNEVPELGGLDRLARDEECEASPSNFDLFARAFFSISGAVRFVVGGLE